MSAGDHYPSCAPLDLPVHLIERLARSKIVPTEAKLRALREWRAEVARGLVDSRARDLMEWLNVAAILVSHASPLQVSNTERKPRRARAPGQDAAPTATGVRPEGR